MDSEKKGIVYLICDPDKDMFKIGRTNSPVVERIKELQTGNACELFLSSYHRTDYPSTIENMFHKHFFSKNVMNEWFKLDMEDVASFHQLAEKFERTIECLKGNPFFSKQLA